MKSLEILEDKKGFTLVEVLIVIAITLIVASVTIPIYGNLQQSTQLNDVTSNMIQTIREAKSRSANGFNDSNHGIYFDSGNSQYVLYQGSSYATRNSSLDRVMEYSESITLTTSLTGNEINFSKGLAEPNNVGDINLGHETGGERIININNSGYAEEN